MSRSLTIVVVGVGCVIGIAVGAVIALAHRSHRPPAHAAAASAQASQSHLAAQAVWPARSRHAPDFLLRDQSNRPFSLRSQRGRVILLTFLDSRCKRACPIEGRLVADVQRALQPARRPALVVVDINPWADTAASTRAAARRWRFASPWYWARGQLPALALVWRKYAIDVRRGGGEIEHSTAVYVLDQAGYERIGYLFPFTVRAVSAAVRVLERSH